MKVKGLIISIAAGTALIVGTAYGIGMGMKKKAQPVEVVSVPSVNEASMGGMGAASTLYGTIISKDTQSVELDTSHTVRKVYVKQGDKVKKGDKLMTYDMDLDKLKREAQDLTRQGLELTLTSMQKDLATMQSGRLPANYGSGDEYQFFNGADSSNTDSDDDSADVEDEDSTLTQAADTVVSGQGPSAGDSSAEGSQNQDAAGSAQAQNPAAENPEEVSGDDGTVVSGNSDDTGNQVIIDPGNEGSDDLPGDGQTVIQDDSDGTQEADPDTLTAVNTFLSDVNRLTGLANEGFDNLSSDTAAAVFQEAFELFRSKLADSGETTVTDFFGASRTVTTYAVKSRVAAMTGNATATVLQQAYDRLCVYQFINAVRQIFPGQMNPSGAYDSAAVSAVSDKIHAAADAYYQLQSSACTVDENGNIFFSTEFSALNDPSFGDQSYGAYFTGLIQTLNLNGQTLFPENPIPQTEMEMSEPGFPGDDGGDGGGTTAQELQQAIEQQKKDIVECQLQIREANLAIKEYDADLQNETVTATMDGIVKQAGTTTEQPSSGGFIVITGKAGMYVQGTLSERSLDSLKVGDMISGTSWDTGSTFSAKITEISKYPSDSESNMYYYDSTNDQNSSQYPFLAYIDDAEGLTAGSTVELSVTSQDTESGLMLPPYLIRTDSAGKSFCYVRGKDDRLARKYVKTKDTGYGLAMILSGLNSDDYIAFPYGDDVKDGAPTKKVETLSAVSGSYYGVG
jgi:multidrug efflux pump subunit AcrA (membrane-fusion protein)